MIFKTHRSTGIPAGLEPGLIAFQELNDAGVVTFNTGLAANNGGDSAGLVIRTKTDNHIILDTGVEPVGSTGNITFQGSTIGSYEIGGDVSFDSTPILNNLGLCCFQAELTASSEVLAAPVTTLSFEGANTYDLTQFFGISAGKPAGQQNGSTGFMSWVATNNRNNSAGPFADFGYILGGRESTSSDPALLNTTFANRVKNLVLEINDSDISSGNTQDETTVTASLGNTPAALSAVVVAGNPSIVASPGQAVVITGAEVSQTPTSTVVRVTISEPIDSVLISTNDVLQSSDSSSFGIGVRFISAECGDPALPT